MKAEIKIMNGMPRLFVNGEVIPPDAYITYFTDKARYGDFSEVGYRLFSIPIFCSSRPINEISQAPCFTTAIFDTDTPRFDVFDTEFHRAIEACPDALILPRINLSPSLAWELENPDELAYEGVDGHPPRPCFSSDKWIGEMKRLLTLIIDHVEKSDYREHVIGYQLAAGHTEEWFSHDTLGSIGLRSREKFNQRCAERGINPDEESYYAFLSDIVAERICELARHAKEKAGDVALVGSFYGYTLECPFREACHSSLDILLNCTDIDFLCSPVSYAHERELGRDHGCMLPTESIILHGKLYFAENDTRTHLTRPPYPDLEYFNRPVFGPRDKNETVEMLKMHYAKALINGYGHWWFDMWGGWFDDSVYMNYMKSFLQLSREHACSQPRKMAEIAVFIDEKAYAGIKDGAVGHSVVYESREALGVMGAPYDIYLASDYRYVKDSYPAKILLKPRDTALSAEIEGSVGTLTVIDTLDEKVLKDFLNDCGIHLYTERKSVIYVNDSFLFLHTSEDGEQKINLREDKKLFEVFEKKYYPSTFESARGKSYLFKIC